MRLRELAFMPQRPNRIPSADENFWIEFPSHSISIVVYLYHALKRSRIITSDTSKIVVEAVPVDSYERPVLHSHGLNVLMVYVPFDIQRYRQIDAKHDRSAMIADSFHDAMKFFGAYRNVDIQPFEQILTEARNRAYTYEMDIGKPIPSPGNQYYIQPHGRWEWNIFFLDAILMDRNKKPLSRKQVACQKNAGAGYEDFCRGGRWVNADEFRIAPVSSLFSGVHVHVDDFPSRG